MEWIRSMLREGKVLGTVAAITAVVWTAGYVTQMNQQVRWLDRLPAVDEEHDYHAALETAQADDIFPAD